MNQYPNPPSKIELRPFYDYNHPQFQLMMIRVHESGKCSNPRTYDASCHSFETRASRDEHEKTCILFTPRHYYGENEEETQTKFLKLIAAYGHIQMDKVRAIYFQDLENVKNKPQKKKETPIQFPPPFPQNQFPNPPSQFPNPPNQLGNQFPSHSNPYGLMGNFFPQFPAYNPYFPMFATPTSETMSSHPPTPLLSTLPSPMRTEPNDEEREPNQDYQDKIYRLEASTAKIENQLSGIVNLLSKRSTASKKPTEMDIEEEPEQEDDGRGKGSRRGRQTTRRSRGRGRGKKNG